MAVGPKHLIAAAGAFGLGMYGCYTWAVTQQALQQQLSKATASTEDHQCHGQYAFDRLAGVYDSIVDWEESSMFYGLMRSRLLSKAQGNVLELSAGTGRNLPYFPYSQMTSLTLTDISAKMLQQAQHKYFDDLQLQYKQPNVTCRFMLADAQQLVAAAGQQPQAVLLPPAPSSSRSGSRSQGRPSSAGGSGTAAPGSIWRLRQPGSSGGAGGVAANNSSSSSSSSAGPAEPQPSTASTAPAASSSSSSSHSSTAAPSSSSASGDGVSRFASHSFDTVVDTFGLCSCEDPVEVLRQAAQLVKPGGKLLLLEHGRGTWDWINDTIDSKAARHYQTYGCWYNRDILSIVQQAGLQVDSCWRWHFGTTYFIVASPAAEPLQQQAAQQQGRPGAKAAQAA